MFLNPCFQASVQCKGTPVGLSEIFCTISNLFLRISQKSCYLLVRLGHSALLARSRGKLRNPALKSRSWPGF